MQKNIFIRTSFEGYHSWEKAPEEVKFLRNKHRHIFNITAYFKVDHNDRDLEFFMVRRALDKFIDKHIPKEDAGSCETIAQFIIENFMPDKILQVSVQEDTENGALISKI